MNTNPKIFVNYYKLYFSSPSHLLTFLFPHSVYNLEVIRLKHTQS